VIAERLLDLLHPSEPSFSPDGTRIAFTVHEAFSRPDEGTSSRIWIAPADGSGARQATRGPRADSSPRWSPDGRTLAFLSDRDHRGRAGVHLLDDGAGEARPVGELEGSAEDVRFSSDGSRLLVLAADPGSDRAGADSATRIEDGDGDPRVSRPSEHWRRLYAIDVATGETARVGPDGVNVWEVDWRGGEAAAVVSDDPSESGWYGARLAMIDLERGTARTIHEPAMQIAAPAISPDAGSVAFVEGFCSDRGILLGETTVVPAAGGPPRVLARDIDVGCLTWRDERTLWFAGARGLAHSVGTLALDGGADVIWSGDESLTSGWVPAVSPSPDGRLLVAAHSAWGRAPELRALEVDAPGSGWRPLSQLNPEAPSVDGACARRTWTSDGLEIEGLLLTPAGHAASLPLVVWVHGGPTDTYDCSHPGARLAGMLAGGYAVLLPNPRGSSGRGQTFARANLGDMGGGDLRDILAGVDAVVAEGTADGDRVAIVGTSYGGFMSAWAVGQTDRFRAAVAMAAVTNWLSFHNTTNIGRFDELFLDADPYGRDGDYFARSPVVHVRRVRTPTLVMHGELDLCVPLSQGQELYQALAAEGVETELVIYAREGHGWRERAHVLDGIERMRAWLDRHLAP
jgi:dipeptidyl aminopeptidase/acylaminoacyl peptidase